MLKMYELYAANYKTGEVIFRRMKAAPGDPSIEDKVDDMLTEVGFGESIWSIFEDDRTSEEHYVEFHQYLRRRHYEWLEKQEYDQTYEGPVGSERDLWLEQKTIEELFELYSHETTRINKKDREETQYAIREEILARLAKTYRELEYEGEVDVHKVYKRVFVQPALKSMFDRAWMD